MCSRIDFFSNIVICIIYKYKKTRDDYGVELRNQVEERLKFLNTGVKPRKNVEVMKEVFKRIQTENTEDEESEEEVKLLKKKKNKDKKKPRDDDEEDDEEEVMNIQEEAEVEVEVRKKKKKTN